MKLHSRILLSLGTTLCIFAYNAYAVHAQTPKTTTTPSLSPTTAKPLDDTLQIIKDKIEEKVDQINQTSKKVVSGTLNKLEDDILELQEPSGKTFKVSIDDTVTKFFTATTKKLSPAEKTDLEKGNTLIIFGPIIEDQISANKVIQQAIYLTVQGEVTNVETDTFTVDIVTSDKEELSLNVEDAVSQQLMSTKTLDLSKATISKYKIGDKVHVVYIKPAKDTDKAQVVRSLIIPQEYFAAPVKPTEKPTAE
ncbi:MAG: hypothetical protein UZ22_OP11002000301 [Microgenomates bacterium OLB23]|nr:MAG: hypothetical protein UZ22_OP11002000301 [Microgenomates bacterium OLB23]